MFQPDENVKSEARILYHRMHQLDKDVTAFVAKLKPLADMEQLDRETEGLIQYGEWFDEGVGEAFVAIEELVHLLNDGWKVVQTT